jgi:hypothetical protein
MRATSPYRVLFTSEAWKQIGQISTASFHALQGTLETIANDMGNTRPVGHDADTPLHVTAAGLLLTYQREDESRTLTIVAIGPASVRE